ncbi:RAN binding protein 1 [Giardia muris]|uniref:RAN binding protein 1 n=1 Tax=Giardia muris TaxID=5742 RepID=A0A4Z1SYN3_GIAMU|nr:RAN binding protein 1 [Giardia muris]|eukprot:TNJ29885.1 RAN binding protein 1 [Giardia muris]
MSDTTTSTNTTSTEATKCGEGEVDYFRIRGKVYRFADNEWKERGQGELLIAHNVEKKRYRLLLHRDQTLKCAVNLPLIEGVVIKQMGSSDKAVTLAGLDFSDNEEKQTMFAVKFPEEWMCKNFRTAIESALAGKELKDEDLLEPPKPTKKPDEDVEGETKEEKK